MYSGGAYGSVCFGALEVINFIITVIIISLLCCVFLFRYSNLESGPATFGVVKQAHDNDMALHENQQVMYRLFHLSVRKPG